uniref:Uncharacterized protein n=1 Tax=Romanomermis culicivorax TaxID=13658 RepID=A0A915I420_ROMCU
MIKRIDQTVQFLCHNSVNKDVQSSSWGPEIWAQCCKVKTTGFRRTAATARWPAEPGSSAASKANTKTAGVSNVRFSARRRGPPGQTANKKSASPAS